MAEELRIILKDETPQQPKDIPRDSSRESSFPTHAAPSQTRPEIPIRRDDEVPPSRSLTGSPPQIEGIREAGRPRPEAPHRFLRSEEMRDPPDIAAKKASDRALEAGLSDVEARQVSEDVNRLVNEQGTHPMLVYRRAFHEAIRAGHGDEDAQLKAREASDQAHAANRADPGAIVEVSTADGGPGEPPKITTGKPDDPFPVFVVNWPDQLGGPGGPSSAPEGMPRAERRDFEGDELADWAERELDRRQKAATERAQRENALAEERSRRTGRPVSEFVPEVQPGPEVTREKEQQAQMARLAAGVGVPGLGSAMSLVSGAAAAAGPAGIAMAAIDAAKGLKQLVNSVTLDRIDQAGRVGENVARLRPGAVADQAIGSLKDYSVDPFGLIKPFEGIGKAAEAVQKFARALDETAEKLKMFSGPLARESALADVAQVRGDIRRAQLLGPELAEFVRVRSRLEQTGQDVLAKILKPLIPRITRLLERIADGVEALDGVGDGVASAVDGVSEVASGFVRVHELLNGILFKSASIEKNTKKEEAIVLNVLDELMQGVDMKEARKAIPLERPNFPIFPVF